MNASKLRYVLMGAILVVVASFVFSTWMLNNTLDDYGREVDHVKIDAEISDQDTSNLLKLQNTLKERHDIVNRASKLLAPSQAKYQDQLIADLKIYANRHHIRIGNISFAVQIVPTKVQPPAGTKRIPFAMALDGAVPYDQFLSFLQEIETNIPKIRVTSLNITPDPKNPSVISSPTFNMEIYVKV